MHLFFAVVVTHTFELSFGARKKRKSVIVSFVLRNFVLFFLSERPSFVINLLFSFAFFSLPLTVFCELQKI